MLHLYAYNPNSEGANELATELGIRRIRHENSTYQGRPDRTVVNWGSSSLPDAVLRSRILNDPNRVGVVSNKLKFFQLCEGTDIRVPEWTTDANVTRTWLVEGSRVVGRRILNGHSGEGIVMCNNFDDLVDNTRLPLYTKYVPKKYEYRVHFAMGGIIDVQRKIKDPDRDVSTWDVRSHANGFIYVRNGVREGVPVDVLQQAQLVVERCGLDFGAIDIIFNMSRDEAYVLEVNTAPGLTGETVTSYANAFRQFV